MLTELMQRSMKVFWPSNLNPFKVKRLDRNLDEIHDHTCHMLFDCSSSFEDGLRSITERSVCPMVCKFLVHIVVRKLAYCKWKYRMERCMWPAYWLLEKLAEWEWFQRQFFCWWIVAWLASPHILESVMETISQPLEESPFKCLNMFFWCFLWAISLFNLCFILALVCFCIFLVQPTCGLLVRWEMFVCKTIRDLNWGIPLIQFVSHLGVLLRRT